MCVVCMYVCVSIFSNISSETTGSVEAKFNVELPWDGGTKVCSNGSGHMANIAAMSIYSKHFKKIFFRAERPMTLKLGMQNQVLKCYHVGSNDDPGLTLTYFTARSNLLPYPFVWDKGKTMDFSETIVVYDIKVGRCS